MRLLLYDTYLNKNISVILLFKDILDISMLYRYFRLSNI